MLELASLSKKYRDGSQTVVAVAVERLTVKAGEQVALTGPSGSGKTTLLHLISGLLTPTSGEIKFDNIAVSAMPETWRDAWRAKHVGYVFQKLNLLAGLSVLDNLLVAMSFAGAVPKPDRRSWGKQLLAQVGLADRLNSLPHQLSTGEQQRVAIARAVANKPRLILADEPTASLDQANANKAMALLQQLAQESGSILLVATHDREIMSLLPRIIPLRQPEGQVTSYAADDCLA
ncbi:ABC transporter ATP-binding protein [Sporomusa aerivorans]|uniref:ABC transporter ATP-binding protein n=1 Tax=Sporomusa aerivorans TaxID=204936 RepID=UPI00352BC0E5